MPDSCRKDPPSDNMMNLFKDKYTWPIFNTKKLTGNWAVADACFCGTMNRCPHPNVLTLFCFKMHQWRHKKHNCVIFAPLPLCVLTEMLIWHWSECRFCWFVDGFRTSQSSYPIRRGDLQWPMGCSSCWLFQCRLRNVVNWITCWSLCCVLLGEGHFNSCTVYTHVGSWLEAIFVKCKMLIIIRV